MRGFGFFKSGRVSGASKNHRELQLTLEYRLNTSAGEPARTSPADQAEWLIAEREPGLLAATLFKPLPSPAVLTSNKLNGQWEGSRQPVGRLSISSWPK